MILLFDENLPPRVADALHALGTVEAYHVTKYLPRGTPDLEVFSFLAGRKWVLVTQDQQLRKRRHELDALRQAGIGAFIITGRTVRSVEEMLAFLASSLPEMRKREHTPRPYVFAISDRRRFDRLV